MIYTDNLALRLPEEEDYYNVDDFNQNAIVIDSEIQKEKDQLDEMKLTFQSGVESTYEACVSKGATPTQHTLTNIATALRNMNLIQELPLIHSHNCNIDGNGFIKKKSSNSEYPVYPETDILGVELSEDYSISSLDNYFLPCEDNNILYKPFANEYYPDYKVSVRLTVPYDSNGACLSHFIDTDEIHSNSYQYTGYYTGNDPIYPEIIFYTDKANHLKIRISSYSYSERDIYDPYYEQHSYELCQGILRDQDDTHYNDFIFDTCITRPQYDSSVREYEEIWYTVSIELNDGKLIMCLYDENEILLERKICNLEWTIFDENSNSNYLGEMSTLSPRFRTGNVSYDINNTYIKSNNSIIWGKDKDNMEQKYPYIIGQTDYQKPGVAIYHDPYELNRWGDSTYNDIESLVYDMEHGTTIGQNLQYYWGNHDERSRFSPKYPLSGSNDFGTWTVSDSFDPSYINNIYIDAIICNSEYFTLADGVTKCQYVVVFVVSGYLSILGKMEEVTDVDYVYSWESCNRRNWCNTCFRGLVTDLFGNIFKEFSCPTETSYNDSTINYTLDYFAIASAEECEDLYGLTAHSPTRYKSFLRTPGTNKNQVKFYNSGTITDEAVDTQKEISYIIGCI